MGKVKIDVTGQRFGRLTAIERIQEKYTKYRCTCDCGNETTVDYSNLYQGITKSCGCLRKEVNSRRKVSDDTLRISEMMLYYRRNAKIKTPPCSWELSREEFSKIVKSPCLYCGYFDKVRFVGIDRIDNTLGYTLSNCVPCCRWCNWGKNERTIEEFKDWVGRLHARSLFY